MRLVMNRAKGIYGRQLVFARRGRSVGSDRNERPQPRRQPVLTTSGHVVITALLIDMVHRHMHGKFHYLDGGDRVFECGVARGLDSCEENPVDCGQLPSIRNGGVVRVFEIECA